MKKSLFLFITAFLLVTQNQSFAAIFKIEMPELLGVHDVGNNMDRPASSIIINVNAGPPFRAVKSARIVLKGTSVPNEFTSKNDSTKIFTVQTKLNFWVHEPCKPVFVRKGSYDIYIGPLTEQFEVEGEFAPDSSFLNRGEANFKLTMWFFPYPVPDKPDTFDTKTGKFVEGFRTDLTKLGTINIKDAYLFVDADSQESDFEKFSTEVPTSKIIFDLYHINFAWGFYLRGFFIDEKGNIWKYDNSCGTGRGLPYGEFTHKELSNKFGYTKFVDKIDKSILMEFYSMVEDVSHGEVKRSSGGNDMGQSVNAAYIFNEQTGKYKEIRISSRGDWNEINTSEAAAKITKWLEEIRKQIENK